MKLYFIEQDEVNGYDTYSDAVVAAESEDDARTIYPDDPYDYETKGRKTTVERIPFPKDGRYHCNDWTDDPAKVKVTYIGEAAPEIDTPRVICTSYHAG